MSNFVIFLTTYCIISHTILNYHSFFFNLAHFVHLMKIGFKSHFFFIVFVKKTISGLFLSFFYILFLLKNCQIFSDFLHKYPTLHPVYFYNTGSPDTRLPPDCGPALCLWKPMLSPKHPNTYRTMNRDPHKVPGQY